MSLVVEVDPSQSNSAEHRTGKYKSGSEYDFYQQKVYVFKEGARYPEIYMFRLPDGQKNYSPGFYELDFNSLVQPDGYCQPSFNSFNGISLQPIDTPPQFLNLSQIVESEPGKNTTPKKGSLFNTSQLKEK